MIQTKIPTRKIFFKIFLYIKEKMLAPIPTMKDL